LHIDEVKPKVRKQVPQRLKFALWDFSRRFPGPGVAIRAAGQAIMGDAEQMRRRRYASMLPDVIPHDEYERPPDVPTQVRLLAMEGHELERAGAAMLLNHLRIPYVAGGLDIDATGAAALLVVGASWSDILALRARVDRQLLIVCFMQEPPPSGVPTGVQAWGAADRLLPHMDGLRSDFAASIICGLRDGLQIPVATGKPAPCVGLRIDDVEGQALQTWLPAMLDQGWRPNLGLFLNSFLDGNNSAGSLLTATCRDGLCDASPHAFDASTFLFFDYPWGRPYTRDEFAGRWQQAKSCFAHYALSLSPVVNTHFHVLSRVAAEMMVDEGAEYFFSELLLDGLSIVPDPRNWPSGDPTLCTRRLDPSGIVQLSSGDNILDVMRPRSYYDFMMHGGTHTEARRRIARRLSLSLDCGFPAYVTTHEYLFSHWTETEHRLLWEGVEADLAGSAWGPLRKVPLGNLGATAKAAGRNAIFSAAAAEHGAITVTMRGSIDNADNLTVMGRGRARSIPMPPGGTDIHIPADFLERP
jgi:hypothetical protein